MSRRCPNCDQRLLEDEQVCWQCGARLEQTLAQEPADRPPESSQEAADQSLILYGAMTVCIALAALLLTSFLGRQPRFRISALSLPESWVIATDHDRSLSVFLPQEWSTFDRTSAGDGLAQTLIAQNVYATALEPLAGFVDDEEVIFLATGTRPSIFLVVARSTILNRLAPSDVVALAGEGDVTLLEARELDTQGVTQAALRIELDDYGTEGVSCRQRFVPGDQSALVFSLCAPVGQLNEETEDNILASLQRLR